jgi:hypothetical protein
LGKSLSAQIIRAGFSKAMMRPILFRFAKFSPGWNADAGAHQHNFKTGEKKNWVERFALRHVTEHRLASID